VRTHEVFSLRRDFWLDAHKLFRRTIRLDAGFHLQLSSSSVDPFYSYRRATSGSTFAARRAGNQQAISATSISNEPVTINVSGSLSLIP
jgi:hypothetical protein